MKTHLILRHEKVICSVCGYFEVSPARPVCPNYHSSISVMHPIGHWRKSVAKRRANADGKTWRIDQIIDAMRKAGEEI